MASPFRIFRKYLKPLMVVFGVMIMFVFVVLDPMAAYLGGGRGAGRGTSREANAVAVRWDGGTLTNQELYHLVQRRQIVNAFIRAVASAGAQAAIEAGMDPRDITYPVRPIIGPETLAEGVEANVVQTKLFADAAREAGMRVTDETIVHYLDQLGRGNVSRAQMRDMLNRLSGDVRIPIQFIIEALREEMLTRNYIASYAYAFKTVTPDQRYKDWLNLNDRIVIEAAPIAVEAFKIDVPEPSEAELVAFFDEHKDREPLPDLIGRTEYPSPTPGFRFPRKIDVQYVQAEYDDYLANAENEVTDDEIAKFYEENKELFIRADAGLTEDEDATGKDITTEEPADGAGESATNDGATDSNEATEPASDAEATEESGATQQTPGEPPSDEAPPADADQSSRNKGRPSGVFRLAAFLQEDQSEAATSADDSAATDPGESDAAPATAPSTQDPQEYQPLEEVRDLIRRRLAQDRVNEQLGKLMSELQTIVNGEFSRYLNERLSAEANNQEPPPPAPALADLAPLAEKHGLKHGKTGPMSWLEFRKMPVGASGDIERQMELYRILFGSDDIEMYEAVLTQDIDGNRYLAMKISDTPGRVPELAEVRGEVIDAWKRLKAADIALKHAEDLAKKAQTANSTLSDFFADESIEVVRTDPFSRYTGGEIGFLGGEIQQQPLRLSEPDGIVAGGSDFLDKVFSLKQGEVGAVLNHDKSIAYVVRVAQHEMTEDERRTAYLAEAHNWAGGNLMMSDHMQRAKTLLGTDVIASRGLKWERTPDEVRQGEDEQE